MLGEIPNVQENTINPVDKSSEFRNKLSQIQGRSLTPDNIDTYATNALNDLIELSDEVSYEYLRTNYTQSDSSRALEDEAFARFGLENLGLVLDHVASVDEQMRRLDALIQDAPKVPHTLVPPQAEMHPIVPGDQEFKEKATISRTKTILFILSNDFNIDLDDKTQVAITSGVLSDTMMRKSSYFMIEVPGLNRTILSCDEEGNVTYVFDNEVLKRVGISSENIATLTKNEINELLKTEPKLGKRIVYSRSFVDSVVRLMTNLEYSASHAGKNEGRYLYPKAPEGVISRKGLRDLLGIDHRRVNRIINQLGTNLGELNIYRFGSMIAEGFGIEQQELIRQIVIEEDKLAPPPLEGVLSALGIAESLEIPVTSVDIIIKELGESLGEIRTYKFVNKITKGYSIEQQNVIKDALGRRGFFARAEGEDVMSIHKIADELNVSDSTVQAAIEALGETLGEVKQYRFGAIYTKGFTLEQRVAIEAYLKGKNLLSELAPDGVLSAMGIAKNLGVDRKTVMKVIEMLGDRLGKTKFYKFRTIASTGYDIDQQGLIKKELQNSGLLEDGAPEGVLSMKGLMDKWGVASETIDRMIAGLGEGIGEVKIYKFFGKPAAGYGQEQQEMIRQALEENNFLTDPPQGVLSLRGIALRNGVTADAIKKTIESLGESIGQTHKYRFKTHLVTGYDLVQQEMIKKKLEARNPDLPES